MSLIWSTVYELRVDVSPKNPSTVINISYTVIMGYIGICMCSSPCPPH